MIQSNELRIGNWISLHGQIIDVDGISMGCINPMWTSGETFYDGYVKDAEPIPLDESWLIRAGFENIGMNVWSNNSDYNVDFDSMLGSQLRLKTSDNYDLFGPIFFHVHQFQNLFFALTGTELTFKD